MRRVWFWGWMGLLCVVVVGMAVFWGWKRPIAPSGGFYFKRKVILPVQPFRQGDERWRRDFLGNTPNTLGKEGCAVTSVAMVLRYYGWDTDPGRLNQKLIENGGYTKQGWIYWEKAVEQDGVQQYGWYEDLPSYFLIDWNLMKGNPVIVRLRYASGITHFVVIVGKDGWDYLIMDPGRGGNKGVYPLWEFGSEIEALRFYKI